MDSCDFTYIGVIVSIVLFFVSIIALIVGTKPKWIYLLALVLGFLLLLGSTTLSIYWNCDYEECVRCCQLEELNVGI